MNRAALPKLRPYGVRVAWREAAGATVTSLCAHRAQESEHGVAMLTHENAPHAAGLPLLAAVDLQDHLMMVSHDLDRLQTLLADACSALLQNFHGAAGQLRSLREGPDAALAAPQTLDRAMSELGRAVVALQFEDMASQLIQHTHRRLRSCVDQLARHTFAGDEDGQAAVVEAPLRPNPVTQDELDAGSVELF